MKWTFTSIGAKAMNANKFDLADAMFKGRWADYTALERCGTFFRETLGWDLDGNKTVFTLLRECFQAEVAATHMTSAQYAMIFHMAYDVWRIIKEKHAKWVPKIVLLMMPKRGGNWGACKFLPDGLDILTHIREDRIKLLVEGHHSSKQLKAYTFLNQSQRILTSKSPHTSKPRF